MELTKTAAPFCDRSARAQLTIDSDAIMHNISLIRRALPCGCRIMAVVKANAYGTSMHTIVKILHERAGIDLFGVAHLDEAKKLRDEGCNHPIFVFHIDPWQAQEAVALNVKVGVGSEAVIAALGTAAGALNRRQEVHLHIDTGMNRYGCRPSDAVGLGQKIATYRYLNLEGAMTHFSSAENALGDSTTVTQTKKFDTIVEELMCAGHEITWRHASNSSAVTRFHFPDYNMARCGIAMYGMSISEESKQSLSLRCALSLTSHITDLRTICKGERVSYNGCYAAKRSEEIIATVPLGYHDGIRRSFSNGGHCLVNGKLASIVGQISMDFLMLNVTEIGPIFLGDPVLIFGFDDQGYFRSPEDFAAEGGTHLHELLATLGPRIKRQIR